MSTPSTPLPRDPTPNAVGTPTPSDDGWIEHTGGECPVDLACIVEVRTRIGGLYAGYGANFGWSCDPDWPDADIVAYRVVRPATPAAPASDLVVALKAALKQLFDDAERRDYAPPVPTGLVADIEAAIADAERAAAASALPTEIEIADGTAVPPWRELARRILALFEEKRS